MAQQVEKAIDDKEKSEPPRFQSSIEVVGETPEAVLERRLRGLDLECAPAESGPPTEADTRAVRPHASPYADLSALAKLLGAKLKKKGPDRFFLYLVRRGDGVGYTVREGRVPDSEFYNTTGTSFEMVEGYPDVESATAALRRLERGFDAAELSASSVPPWVTRNCRPSKK